MRQKVAKKLKKIASKLSNSDLNKIEHQTHKFKVYDRDKEGIVKTNSKGKKLTKIIQKFTRKYNENSRKAFQNRIFKLWNETPWNARQFLMQSLCAKAGL